MSAAPSVFQRGLTLVETLVTLMLFALLFLILMTGWQQALTSQSRVTHASQRGTDRERLTFMVRQAIAEAATVGPATATEPLVRGDARQLFIESSSSMDPRVGAAPRPLALKLEPSSNNGATLVIDHGQAPPLPSWLLDGTQAHWRYGDAQGTLHGAWPPQTLFRQGSGEPHPAPAFILLEWIDSDGTTPRSLIAAPRASNWRLPVPSPPMFGLQSP